MGGEEGLSRRDSFGVICFFPFSWDQTRQEGCWMEPARADKTVQVMHPVRFTRVRNQDAGKHETARSVGAEVEDSDSRERQMGGGYVWEETVGSMNGPRQRIDGWKDGRGIRI